jgi:hypothetical protein
VQQLFAQNQLQTLPASPADDPAIVDDFPHVPLPEEAGALGHLSL